MTVERLGLWWLAVSTRATADSDRDRASPISSSPIQDPSASTSRKFQPSRPQTAIATRGGVDGCVVVPAVSTHATADSDRDDVCRVVPACAARVSTHATADSDRDPIRSFRMTTRSRCFNPRDCLQRLRLAVHNVHLGLVLKKASEYLRRVSISTRAIAIATSETIDPLTPRRPRHEPARSRPSSTKPRFADASSAPVKHPTITFQPARPRTAIATITRTSPRL